MMINYLTINEWYRNQFQNRTFCFQIAMLYIVWIVLFFTSSYKLNILVDINPVILLLGNYSKHAFKKI